MLKGLATYILQTPLIFMLIFCVTLENQGHSDTLRGDTGAVSNELEDLNYNPANAGFFRNSQIGLSLDTLSQQTFKFQYPQTQLDRRQKNVMFEPPTKIDQVPFHYIWVPSRGFGLGLMALPPLKIDGTFSLSRIPVYILNTPDLVDINIRNAMTHGFVSAFAGYRLTERFSIGFSFHYLSASADAEILSSNSKTYLTEVEANLISLTSKLGIRWVVVPKFLTLGVASKFLSTESLTIELTENAVEGIPNLSQDREEVELKNPLDSILIGIKINFGRQAINLDLERTKADEDIVMVSLKDFKEKNRDLYDTLAVRLGFTQQISRSFAIFTGAKYEPTPIGPGDQDENGYSGFGTIDLVQIAGLGEPLKPYKQFSIGVNYRHIKSHRAVKRKSYQEVFSISAGLAYREASLGIDQSGEVPAAYYMKKTWVPVSLTYHL